MGKAIYEVGCNMAQLRWPCQQVANNLDVEGSGFFDLLQSSFHSAGTTFRVRIHINMTIVDVSSRLFFKILSISFFVLKNRILIIEKGKLDTNN